MINRRDALKRIGGLAGAAGLSRLLSACGDNSGGGPEGITTVVYMMLENRSYDHYFGARKLVEGRPGDGLDMTMSCPDSAGNMIKPFEPTKDQMCVPDPPHDWDAQHASFDGGKCDGCVKAYETDQMNPMATAVMQYLTRTELPISYALADGYTTCDRWCCSVMGPTLPNRAYWHTATSLGLKDNTAILNAFSSGLPVPSIYNKLHDANVDWAYYYGSIPVVSLLANGGPYHLDLGPADGTGNVRRFGDPAGGTGQFFKDAAAGKLPSVVYIDPAFYVNDDHPPIHPINGQALIAAVYTALATSPQWKNCLLVVTYDENGGFFDHFPPPMTTDDTLAKFGVDGFQQMGFRVPAMVVGPYVKQNYVSSVQYDHTSALKHLQTMFGLETLNVRMDAANDLMDCIDMDRLAKGKWSKPIDLPAFDVADWPQPMDQCSHTGGFRLEDPISLWADAHPSAFAGLDLRGELPGYNASIRNYLRAHGLLRG